MQALWFQSLGRGDVRPQTTDGHRSDTHGRLRPENREPGRGDRPDFERASWLSEMVHHTRAKAVIQSGLRNISVQSVSIWGPKNSSFHSSSRGNPGCKARLRPKSTSRMDLPCPATPNWRSRPKLPSVSLRRCHTRAKLPSPNRRTIRTLSKLPRANRRTIWTLSDLPSANRRTIRTLSDLPSANRRTIWTLSDLPPIDRPTMRTREVRQ